MDKQDVQDKPEAQDGRTARGWGPILSILFIDVKNLRVMRRNW
jgi:hypothetical protein